MPRLERLAHPPPMQQHHPADKPFVALLQSLQGLATFQHQVRATLIQLDEVGDCAETWPSINANWLQRIEASRQSMIDLDAVCQRQINQVLEPLHDLYREQNSHPYNTQFAYPTVRWKRA